ncbi:hypothetical protein SAG0136_08435 [Streptococcus agalactiae LMG 14747]|uniref:CAAX amino terminal protease n=1 Tax=Streptococcus agalactiae LMG 14747 TaxID=1154860 RepID=V6Z2W0_STRAG|nr:hypothetical protein SAG0136_08435 [Streptococcus agalactiae LMG 14747]
MLEKTLKTMGKKKTEEAYAKLLRKQTVFGFIGGICLLALLSILEMSDYQLGMMVGLAFGLFIFAGASYATQKDPKKLHQAYVSAYDERNQLIIRLTTTWTLVFLLMVMCLLILLDGFFGLMIPYRLLLAGLIYFCLICLIGMKALLNRFL